jgi:hypothetical protein
MPCVSSGARKNDWLFWLLIPAVLVCAAAAVVVRHQWPKLFTADDIAIFGAALTLAATITAVKAAQASRDAASDSRRALQLHFQPGDVRVEFRVRDPNNPDAKMVWNQVPDGAPLWLHLIFWQPMQSEYEIVWVDSSGRSSAPRHLRPPVGGECEPLLLDGLTGREDRSDSFPRVIAAVPKLLITCRDDRAQARWSTSMSVPTPEELGSRALTFELVDQ